MLQTAIGNNQFTACISACMGALSFGYVIGYTSPALPDLLRKGVLVEGTSAWFASSATIGGLIGSPLAGWTVEKFGRRKTLVMMPPITLVGWVLIYSQLSFIVMTVGRLLTGLTCGMIVVVGPMYIAETAPKEKRGMFGSGVQLSITLGILVVNALGIYCNATQLALVAMCIPIVDIYLAMRIPESPRYSLMKGAKQDALRSLAWLRGHLADIDEECRDIEDSLPPKDEVFSFSEFSKPELFHPLLLAIGMQLFQQFSGINAVMFYTVSIFQSAHIGNETLAATLINLVQVVFTAVACVLMDKSGRRFLLILAGIGMAITNCTLGLYYYKLQSVQNTAEAGALSWLALVSLIGYIIAFAIGLGPIPMLVSSEIFPFRAKGPACGLSTMFNWLSAFIITLSFPGLTEVLGSYGVFWLFSICCVVGVLFVCRYIPETKGKSLEDIELYFLGRSARHF